LIRVDSVDIGQLPRDDLQAKAVIEVGEEESLDLIPESRLCVGNCCDDHSITLLTCGRVDSLGEGQ